MSLDPWSFHALVDEARPRVREVPADAMPDILRANPQAVLVDVREESEFAAGHILGAEWIGKGVIERDIEARHPDRDAALFLYCGGGYRSVLAADSLRRMGYLNVVSIDGGWHALRGLLPVTA